MNLKEAYFKNKNTIVCVLIFIISISAFYLFKEMGMDGTYDSLKPYLDADKKIEKTIKYSPDFNKNIHTSQLKLLQNQYEIINHKKMHHLEIAKMMNAYYYAATIVLLILSVFLGILIIQLADTGIKEKTSLFKTTFFSILSLVTFFGLLIQVLNHKENIYTNKKAFLDYSSVQLRIYNYIITDGEELSATQKDTLSFKQFTTSINREINTINTIAFEITPEDIKSPNNIIDYGK